MPFKDKSEMIDQMKINNVQYTLKFTATTKDKEVTTICQYCDKREKFEKEEENGFE